jgi:hypothetical protein
VLRPVSRTREGTESRSVAWETVRSVWTSGRAVSLHVALIFFVPACVALTWWQVSRALDGNTLSWVYTFEWPIFAAYATYMWWKLVHDDPALAARHGVGPGAGPEARQGEPDEELDAYNRYLADLNASGRQKRW